MGDKGTPKLCLRDVDMDLTSIGKLSMSGSPSKSIVGFSFTSSDPFDGSIVSKSPFRVIVTLSPAAGSEESELRQPGTNLGLR